MQKVFSGNKIYVENKEQENVYKELTHKFRTKTYKNSLDRYMNLSKKQILILEIILIGITVLITIILVNILIHKIDPEIFKKVRDKYFVDKYFENPKSTDIGLTSDIEIGNVTESISSASKLVQSSTEESEYTEVKAGTTLDIIDQRFKDIHGRSRRSVEQQEIQQNNETIEIVNTESVETTTESVEVENKTEIVETERKKKNKPRAAARFQDYFDISAEEIKPTTINPWNKPFVNWDNPNNCTLVRSCILPKCICPKIKKCPVEYITISNKKPNRKSKAEKVEQFMKERNIPTEKPFLEQFPFLNRLFG